MYYTLNGSYPDFLPYRIKLSDGTTRTDPGTFTEEEIADAGYILVDPKPNAAYPNVIEWDGIGWVVRGPNLQEINDRKAYIKSECVTRLAATDYKVIKAVELGETPPADYVAYRQQLRDLYNNPDSVDIWFFEFPSPPATQE